MARAAMPSSSAKPRTTRALHVKGNRWLRLRYLVVLAVLVWAGWRFWNVEMPQATALRQQQQSLQSQLNSLQTQQNELKRKVAEFHNPLFLQQYATQHYGLVSPGQQLFDVAPKH